MKKLFSQYSVIGKKGEVKHGVFNGGTLIVGSSTIDNSVLALVDYVRTSFFEKQVEYDFDLPDQDSNISKKDQEKLETLKKLGFNRLYLLNVCARRNPNDVWNISQRLNGLELLLKKEGFHVDVKRISEEISSRYIESFKVDFENKRLFVTYNTPCLAEDQLSIRKVITGETIRI
ncbi:MAG: hypothetical protein VXZ40_04570 [Nanoarchaeota archaeon]|nr:hypothetical protein [Nanoarchaeota archaeon]